MEKCLRKIPVKMADDMHIKESFSIAAVMIHVSDTAKAIDWYEKAFIGSTRCVITESDNFEYLDINGVHLEIVPADSKVASGAAGSVVYWNVYDFDQALEHMLACGASLYRGPLAIEHNQKMCQVQDPWGNCIGLRGDSRKVIK